LEQLIQFETSIDFGKDQGLLIGVIDGDSTAICAFGAIEKKEETTGTMLFELGDLTQVVTATLVLQLAQNGTLSLDAPLNNLLPESWENESSRHLTLHQLLTHTSGLPRVPPGFGEKIVEQGQPYAHYSKDDLREFYQTFDFGEAGTAYHYAPVNYAVIEVAVENATGKPFDMVLTEQVLGPPGMTDTWFEPAGGQKPVQGFSKAGLPAEAWQFQSFEAALGLKSTMYDLLLYLRATLDGNLMAPDLGKNGSGFVPTGIRKDTRAAAGWHVIRRRKRPNIVTHTGWTNGHRTAMAYLYGTRKGVVILSNTTAGLDGLEFRVLDLLWDGKRKAIKKK
jgi:serine-type D-Ala-D-Ala carboxypeptidase/endopeptidase